MFRLLFVSIYVAVLMTAAPVGSTEASQSANIPTKPAVSVTDQAGALYSKLYAADRRPQRSIPLTLGDFTDRPETPAGQCLIQCDQDFVQGYGLCRAMIARLSSTPSHSDVPNLDLSSCGNAAMSGLSLCRKACGVSPIKPVAETSR